MKDKILPIVNLCIALFVILYAAFIYRVTHSISLVTVVILIAGLAPVLHMAWTYMKIKIDEYQDQYYRHYLKK